MSATLDIERPKAPPAPLPCRHCGAPVVAGAGAFCCSGCAAAYALVQELGLGRYYRSRALDPHLRAPRPPDDPVADLGSSVVAAKDGGWSLDLLVDGLHCAACVWLIESALRHEPDVREARVNLTGRRLHLAWGGVKERAAALVGLVQRLGYRVAPFEPGRAADAAEREERALFRALAVTGFAAANVMLLSVSVWAGVDMGPATRDLLHWFSALIALPAIAYGGRPFFRSAAAALKAGRTNMDVPISAGVLLATGLSLFETIRSGHDAYFDSAVTLLFFLLVGRVLDRRARGRARSAAEHLLRIAATPATVIDAGGVQHRVPASAVAKGDTILVAAGERIVVDGAVAAGHSAVDRSLVSGESLPEPVAPGSAVLAGMLNLDAPLRLTVTAIGDATFLAEIVRLMEAAEQSRARLVVLADRIARRYAPVVHGLALATFLAWLAIGPWQAALENAIAVLIITCPCALGLAVPVVQVVASGRLMRRGILLKSGTALERLAAADTVIFDKTGTLTLGRLTLDPDAARDGEALAGAAELAATSRHPLSRALCRAAGPVAPAADVQEHPGAGLSRATDAGEVRLGSRAFCGVAAGPEDDRPELWLARPRQPPYRLAFGDALRPDARAVTAALAAAGKRVLLLSGDRPAAVAAAAREAGIAEWHAQQSPADKTAVIARLAAEGRKVLMVGDGLNDGPALAAAYVSISPSTAADVCQTAADIVFQGDSLGAVTECLRVAGRARRTVRQNIALAILYNVAAVPLAMLGQVTPLLAAAAMSGSSLLVVGNALTLARRTG
jgi:Cu2+-exporting ATPase